VARHPGKFVAQIGPELALPLAHAYCRHFGLEFDPEAGERMFFVGAFVRSGLRAVCGLASLEGAFLVSGIFTDGSPYAPLGARMIGLQLASIPCALVGTLHLPAYEMRRLFRKDGWQLTQGVVA
jgi:hypothetical protein